MNHLEDAVRILKAGGLVAFPTETVYGLGADALNEHAVARVFEVKGRPTFDPLIVHVPDLEGAKALAKSFPPLAEKLARAFWPGPLTLVLPKQPRVPDLVTAGLDTVALRAPAHPLALELLRAFGGPLAAPSANPFGLLSPPTAHHVQSTLGHLVDLILDGGPCRVGVESTVVSLAEDDPVLLRPGGTAVEELEKICGKLRIPAEGSSLSSSPGRLERHYALATPLYPSDRFPDKPTGERWGYLAFSRTPEGPWAATEVLSPSGDNTEAAARLFHCLHLLDEAGLDAVVYETVPDEGLGRAINDRLRRASAKNLQA